MSSARVLEEIEGPPPILDAEHYEIINGERVETTRMGAAETWMAFVLTVRMAAAARGIGRVITEMMFVLGKDGNSRRPDAAFVSYKRWPRSRAINPGAGWNVVPDLVIEVVSPSNTATEIIGKKGEYFRAGVAAVWVVYPDQREIHVWDSANSCRALAIGDDLDGGSILPGFRMAVADLFDVETEPLA